MTRHLLKYVTITFISIGILWEGNLFAQKSEKTKPHVYFFLLEECVICQSYSNKMNKIASEYDSFFVFKAIFPSFISKPESIKKYLTDYNISLPFKTDYYKELTKKLGVTVTPEVVIFHPETNNILYRGRIDNEFVTVGRRRRSGISEDLIQALNQVKSGKNPDPAIVPSIGCLINLDEMEK